jgi:hypothetical protein
MQGGEWDELGGDVEGEGRQTTREGSTTQGKLKLQRFITKGGVTSPRGREG